MSRKPLKTNFAINLFAPLVRAAIALVTIPIYVRHVGDARYGVISILWILLGYFGFLDLGLTRAATQRASEAPRGVAARALSSAAHHLCSQSWVWLRRFRYPFHLGRIFA